MSDYPMLISNKLHSFRNFWVQIYESIICNTRSYKYVSKLPGGYLCRKTIDCHDEKRRKKIYH